MVWASGGLPRRFSRRALLAAAGSAVLAGRLAVAAIAAGPAGYRFTPAGDRAGWGEEWYAAHTTLAPDVRGGAARLTLPEGLHSTADDQPVPVLLLVHDCRDGTHELRFRVTDPALRPGLLLRRRNLSRYLGVTVEADRLVLAAYARTRRRVLASAPVRTLGSGDHVLRVTVSGRDLEAGLWRAGHPRQRQLRARVPAAAAAGASGVLLVAPRNRTPGTLLVHGYRLW